jgi:hypothetical protein
MKMQIAATFFGLIVAVSAQSFAADFPKSGAAEYDTYYVFEKVATMDSGVGTSAITEFTGITRNVKGDGPFHNMSVHCLMHSTVIADKWDGSGSCVETDLDGDNVLTKFDADAHYIVGGTGKYKGITGKAPYSDVELKDTAGGRNAAVVNHKVSWEIK